MEFHKSLESATPIVPVFVSKDMLSSFDPEFWPHCFVDLFFRGDCAERVAGGRQAPMPAHRWAKCLLTRADFKGWRTNLEFVACLYNILLRRSQMRSVHLVMVKESRLSAADIQVLAEISARDFVSEALASGDCD